MGEQLQLIASIASMPVGGLAVYVMYRLASNHIEHNTDAVRELQKATHEQTSIFREFIAWMKGRESKNDASR